MCSHNEKVYTVLITKYINKRVEIFILHRETYSPKQVKRYLTQANTHDVLAYSKLAQCHFLRFHVRHLTLKHSHILQNKTFKGNHVRQALQ